MVLRKVSTHLNLAWPKRLFVIWFLSSYPSSSPFLFTELHPLWPASGSLKYLNSPPLGPFSFFSLVCSLPALEWFLLSFRVSAPMLLPQRSLLYPLFKVGSLYAYYILSIASPLLLTGVILFVYLLVYSLSTSTRIYVLQGR